MNNTTNRRKLPEIIKRAVDLGLAFVGLILLSPILLLIALVIKLDSSGNVIFAHQRIGKDGRAFKMYKFRSMISSNSDTGYMQYLHQLIESEKKGGIIAVPYRKMEGDPRVTRVGKILRCFYLDELPQLINVIKGDMSLVGPRPHVQFEVDHYNPEQRRRLSVKPGVTGLWQVEGKANCTFSELIQLDLDYIDHWSFWLDFRILIKTCYSLVHGGERFIVRMGRKVQPMKDVVIHDAEPIINRKS